MTKCVEWGQISTVILLKIRKSVNQSGNPRHQLEQLLSLCSSPRSSNQNEWNADIFTPHLI